MTTDIDDKVLSSLEKWVVQDGKPVTARLLAVQHKISMQSARAHMQHLLDGTAKAQSVDGKPYALWLLSGQIASQKMELDDDFDDEDESANAESQGILLADDEQLSEVKARFVSSPSVCLYALSPPLGNKPTRTHKAAAASQLITIQHDLKNTPEYVKTWHESDRGASLGAIRPADDVTFVGNASNLSAGVVDQKKDAKSHAGSAAAATEHSKAEFTKAKGAAEANKPKGASSLFKSTTTQKAAEKATSKPASTSKAKPEVDDDDDEDEDGGGPIGYADEASAAPAAKAKPATKAAAKPKRADAGDKKLTQEERRKLRKQELMDLADDDHDGNADPDVLVAASTSTSMMGGSTEAGAEKETVQANAKPKEKRRVKKQRTVMRKETSKDAKGYRVTREVEGYESYSSFESSDDEDEPQASKVKEKGAAKVRASKSKKEAAEKSETKADADDEVSTHDTAMESQESEQAPPSAQPPTTKPSVPPPNASAPPPKKPAPTPSTTKAASGQQKLSSFFTRKS